MFLIPYCSVLQCVAVCCSVLQCVAVWHMSTSAWAPSLHHLGDLRRLWFRIALCCSVLQRVAAYCSVTNEYTSSQSALPQGVQITHFSYSFSDSKRHTGSWGQHRKKKPEIKLHLTILVHADTSDLADCRSPRERWGAGVETQKNVREEIGGWGRVPFNEPYAPLLSTIYDGA